MKSIDVCLSNPTADRVSATWDVARGVDKDVHTTDGVLRNLVDMELDLSQNVGERG